MFLTDFIVFILYKQVVIGVKIFEVELTLSSSACFAPKTAQCKNVQNKKNHRVLAVFLSRSLYKIFGMSVQYHMQYSKISNHFHARQSYLKKHLFLRFVYHGKQDKKNQSPMIDFHKTKFLMPTMLKYTVLKFRKGMCVHKLI